MSWLARRACFVVGHAAAAPLSMSRLLMQCVTCRHVQIKSGFDEGKELVVTVLKVRGRGQARHWLRAGHS